MNRNNARSGKPLKWAQSEGCAFPLGATVVAEDRAINFAIYSKHATDVALLLFASEDLKHPCYRYDFDFLKNKSGPVWHCRLPLDIIGKARFYGYQIDGPAPANGYSYHFFDAGKLLLDPYARSVHFPPGFSRKAAMEPGSNIGLAPLGCLPTLQKDTFKRDMCRLRHDHDLIIYEMHVKGFTANANSGLPTEKRGKFAGVIEKIPYLLELGITAVEFLPVFQFDPQSGDYWGYMPLNMFAPHNEYSSQADDGHQFDEFREMAHELHAAGIEVILDVVFNHTCEGGLDGPTYSLKGIDNSTYYMLSPEAENPFVNFSGTGNTLHTVNAATRQMIIDSLRYWVQDMQVDGFRFDLASIFTRYPDGRINTEDPPIFSQIAAEDDLAGVRLIAEPWDAVGTNQLGRKFPGHLWMQWNADYRDTIQRYVRGDGGVVADLMTRLYGSADHFPDDRMHAFRPLQSVNYVASHDGMTMYDLVSYEKKNNWANGQENQDGPEEFRCNCGWEGERNLPAEVLRKRIRRIKNHFAILMLSNGTPMFRMGDEFLQTQHGNNNPFNQDNETVWLDWNRLKRHSEVYRFFRQMIAFRKSHPSISRSRYWRDDIHWFGTAHEPDLSASSKTIAWCLHGASQQDNDIYAMLNMHDDVQRFGVFEGAVGEWQLLVDTSREEGADIVDATEGARLREPFVDVNPQSVVVLVR